MFTINIYLKLALIVVFLIGGTALAFTINFWYAFPLILIGLGLFVSYLLLGTVQSAAELMLEDKWTDYAKENQQWLMDARWNNFCLVATFQLI